MTLRNYMQKTNLYDALVAMNDKIIRSEQVICVINGFFSDDRVQNMCSCHEDCKSCIQEALDVEIEI